MRSLTLILLTCTLVMGVFYYRSADSLRVVSNSDDIGAGYFPKLLAIALIGLTLVSIIQTIREKTVEKFELGNAKMVVLTVILTFFYIFTWIQFQTFYISTFIFLFTLIYLFQPNRKSKKILFLSLMSTSIVLIGIYIFFEKMLQIQF